VDATQVHSWITIGADESITVYSGKIAFGQGFSTVQTQLISEELSVPLNRINVILGDTGFTPDQAVTYGSQTTPTEFRPGGLRQAVDTARDALFQPASQQLGVATSQLTLNSQAIRKDPRQYIVLGTSVPRMDPPAKATGQFQYVQHVRLLGMLHGKVVRPPSVGAAVVSVDEGSVADLPGHIKVVVKNNFACVVADPEWNAIQAAKDAECDMVAGRGERSVSASVSDARIAGQFLRGRRCSGRKRIKRHGEDLVGHPGRLSPP